MRRAILGLLMLALLSFLGACGGILDSSITVYELIEQPTTYHNQDVTVQGQYLWKPGNPGLSVLVPAVSTRDDGTDAQPITVAKLTAPDNGLIWLENFPADVSGQLHRPVDSVYGMVEVQGRFEANGAFGPDGTYGRRLTITSAKVIERIQRVEHVAPREVPAGLVSVHDLASDPARFNGQTVTTHGFYFWTPATSGLLATGVQAEAALLLDDAGAGVNPQPIGEPIAMEGFPPNLSAQLNVGPANGFVWGLVEVRGTFQTAGQFGLGGIRTSQLILDPASVKPLK